MRKKRNLFEVITTGRTKKTFRYKLDLNNMLDYLDSFALKKNKSFISLYMLDHEIFLGEVNEDLSSLPAKEIRYFASYIRDAILNQLEDFAYSDNCQNTLHGKSKCRLRYIVNPDTEGVCMAFECDLDLDRVTFIPETMAIDSAFYDTAWLDYWYDRKAYFS